MKNLLILFALALIFTSCEDGLFDLKLSTDLKKDITVDVEDKDLKSTLHPFSVTDTLDLKDNSDIKAHISKIKAIDIDEALCTLSGIPENEEIAELTITIVDANISVTLLNLTKNSLALELPISATDLTAIENYIESNEKLIINVSGTSTYAPMQLIAELLFKTTFTTSLAN